MSITTDLISRQATGKANLTKHLPYRTKAKMAAWSVPVHSDLIYFRKTEPTKNGLRKLNDERWHLSCYANSMKALFFRKMTGFD